MKSLALLLWTSLVVVCGCGSSTDPAATPEEVTYESYRIALPAALLGDYAFGPSSASPPYGRLGEFRLPANLRDFGDMRLIIGGSWVTGQAVVFRGSFDFADTIDLFVNLKIDVRPVDSPEAVFEATALPPLGQPSSPAEFLGAAEFSNFQSWDRATRAQLLGTDLIATLTYTRTLNDVFAVLSPSYGTITDLTLELENAIVLE